MLVNVFRELQFATAHLTPLAEEFDHEQHLAHSLLVWLPYSLLSV